MVETEYPVPFGATFAPCVFCSYPILHPQGMKFVQETFMKCLVAVCQEPLSSMACGVSSSRPSLLGMVMEHENALGHPLS